MKREAIVALCLLIVLPLLLSRPAAQQGPASWSEPVNLGSPINSEFAEAGGALSEDGLSFYFNSNRPCGAGDSEFDQNIWVARRSSMVTPWQVECLRINVDEYSDAAPDLSTDGHWLYFVSDRPGSTGTQADRRDIWVSRRADTRNDQGWSEPVNLGPPVNTEAVEAKATFFVVRESRYFRLLTNQKLITQSTRNNAVGDTRGDLWEVNLMDGVPFGAARRIDEISTAEFGEGGPSVGGDGLELFFHSARTGSTNDIFAATRRESDLPWSTPVPLASPVNTSANIEQNPNLSPDGRMLFFQSNRPGGLGAFDIWVSTRNVTTRSAR